MSKHRSWITIVILAGAVWCAMAAVNQAQSEVAVSGTKVAVVDLFRVFNDCQQTLVLNKKMEEHQSATKDERDRRLADIEMEQKTLADYAPDSADYQQQVKKLKRLQLEYKVWAALEQDNIDANHLFWTRKTYNMVNEEIAATAQRRGIELVVTRDDVDEAMDPSLGPVKQRTLLLQQILNRKVVYSNEAIELTDEVLKSLDSRFDREGGASAVQFTR